MQAAKRNDESRIAKKNADNPNQVFLSLRFLIGLFLSAILFSYVTGRGCRLIVLNTLKRSPASIGFYDISNLVPLMAVKRIEEEPRDNDRNDDLKDHKEEASDENEDIIPGRQLLVDIENVNGLFLNSKQRLKHAITKYLDERNSNGVLFQPTCESLRVGLFCFVMLKDGGRVTLNTWPLMGTLSINILLNNSDETLISDVELVKDIFGVPRKRNRFGVEIEDPYMRWATRSRGFSENAQNPEQDDIRHYITSTLERPWKQRVASVETAYQSIEIYDMLHPRLGSIQAFDQMKNNPNSYEAQNPHLFRPDRLIYLDGVLQSRFFGESAYHESLVHPALLAHPNPRRVAIIGGGEGATMREVLKHNTIETVTMIEIDEEMVRFSRQFIPEWSDCSFLEGSNGSCYDDPRAELYCVDAVAWFVDHYGEKRDKSVEKGKYDVIIMDVLDPDSKTPFSDVLYNNKEFTKALYDALTEDGIFILQTGMAADGKELPASYQETSYERILERNLEAEGFVRMYDYADAHGGFLDVWTFMIAFKSFTSERRWFANQAQVDMELHRRSMPTKSGDTPFLYFDGATMASFQLPSRVTSDFKCKMNVHPGYCRENNGFDPHAEHFHTSSMVDINGSVVSSGAYMGLDQAVNALEFELSTRNVVDKLSRIQSKVQIIGQFMNDFVAPICIEGLAGLMDPSKPELAQFLKTKTSDGLFCENQFHVWNERDLRSRRVVLLHGENSPFVA